MAPRSNVATEGETSAVEVKASVRYLHVSPTKVRPVLDLVRGLPAEDAERILRLTPRDSAGDILKVLDSAIANGEHNFQLPAEELFIARCWCDEGPTRGAGRARARGRYFRIRKRTSHITIVLARLSDSTLETRRVKAEASGTGRAATARKRSDRVRASRRAAQGIEEHDHDHDHEEVEDTADVTTEVNEVETTVPEELETAEVAEASTDDAPEASADSVENEEGE
jgi:large subunit ribosomal protein L22